MALSNAPLPEKGGDGANFVSPEKPLNIKSLWDVSPSGRRVSMGEESMQSAMSSSPSESSHTVKGRRLSGRQRNQLKHMFEKKINDEDCAGILGLDVELVSNFHQRLDGGESPEKEGMSLEERVQLQQLFQRQISAETCANILHVPVTLVQDFKAEEEEERKRKEYEDSLVGRARRFTLNTTSSVHTKAQEFMADPKASMDIMQEQVKRLSLDVRSKAQEIMADPKGTMDVAQGEVSAVALYVKRLSFQAAINVQTKAQNFVNDPMATLKDRTFQVTAGGAAAGSVVGGVTGGGAGTVIGGTIGTAAGVIPSFVTFGASIPIGMAVGSGVGLCTGIVVGASFGAVAGGSSGYCGFVNRKAIHEKGASLLGKARSIADDVKVRASDSIRSVTSKKELEQAVVAG